MASPISKLKAFQMVHPFAARQILKERNPDELNKAEIDAALEQFESRGLGIWASNKPVQSADDLEARSDSIRAKFGTKNAYRIPPMK